MIRRFHVRRKRQGLAFALRYLARYTTLSRVLRALHWFAPTPRTDRLYAYIDFVRKIGRPPTERMLLNDVLYRYKVGGELASPVRVRTSDKELVKRYIAEKVGERYNIPTIAVLRSEEEIRGFAYPERCVIKPTHATGRVILRQGGEPIDLDTVVGWLDHDQYVATREPQYRGLERKVIVEPLLDFVHELDIFCYRGEVRFHQYQSPHPMRLFGPGWVDLGCSISRPITEPMEPIAAPARLEDIERVAAALSEDFGLVRVDLYVGIDDGSFVVGELTHCHAGGGHPIWSREHEAYIADLLFSTTADEDV